MEVKHITLLYFSPTKTTKKTLEAVASGLGGSEVVHVDLTYPDADTRQFDKIENTFAVIGIPVYGGRVPALAVERLKRLSAADVPAALVAVYGNREFEDALVELQDITTELGFATVAAGAFIGEHSFSTDEMPIASGRPDGNDISMAEIFGQKTAEKLAAVSVTADIKKPEIPGNRPYKEKVQRGPVAPIADETLCTLCGECVSHCPSGAITMADTVLSDAGKCIVCHSCVKICPENAMGFHAKPLKDIAKWLFDNFSAPKEPQMFL